ncbi:MAG: GPW/gp25 family protein [Polyangiaceae bacterium]
MFLYKHFEGGTNLSELEDVMRNLGYVLRTKRGTGYFLQNFGLSEVGFRTPEEMVTALTAEIRENVRLYEPRVELTNVDEEYDDDGKRAKLLVGLRLRDKKQKLQIVVDLSKNSLEIVPVEDKKKR